MEAFKHAVDSIFSPDPRYFTTLVFLAFGLFLWKRRFFTSPPVALFLFILATAFFAVSMTDAHFKKEITKPDNIPIMIVLLGVGFFVWLSLRRGVINDERMARGEVPLEKIESDEKILTWPDLVYTECVCSIVIGVLLLVWGILIKAPIEEAANPTRTPNPSKAPWYFLALQEMLVYFDPWIAGVLFPGTIIAALIAIPFLDRNPKGQGYFTFRDRSFAITMFLFGFVILWVFMMFLGTLLRGPNWNFFGLYEPWTDHKVVPLTNVNLSEYFWVSFLRQMVPKVPAEGSALAQAAAIFVREGPGILLTVFYLALVPLVLAKTFFRKFYIDMGFIRYQLFSNFFLLMMSLPIKMYLRWLFNLKYVVAIPEWFFNI